MIDLRKMGAPLSRFSSLMVHLCLLTLVVSACVSPQNQATKTAAEPSLSASPTKVFTIFPSSTLAQPIKTDSETEIPQILTTLSPPARKSNSVNFPDPTDYEWRLIVSGLTSPIGLVNAGDDSGRLFVVEQPGLIRIFRDGALLPEPFLDISGKLSCCGERGLLGLAFHPNYDQNGYFFVNYTDLNGDTVISRFQVSNNSELADQASEIQLLGVAQPFPNHNGGGLAFGPDGYLYVGLGDGGSAGDPLGNAQNTHNLLGKLLRLDVDQSDLYAVPTGNPFAESGGAPEIWFFGLRNPWRFSFDSLTGDLFIGDVGQGSWEEVDYLSAGIPGGANLGWNYREGSHPYSASSVPDDSLLIDPVAEYGHDQGISVIGGVIYRGEQLPDWQGIYLYGDYGSGIIWGLFQAEDGSWQNTQLFQTGNRITSFGEDESGEVYYVDPQGSIFKLVHN
jgi:glucose/arabinose dehydrogenase